MAKQRSPRIAPENKLAKFEEFFLYKIFSKKYSHEHSFLEEECT
jgi:hypothetical protein